MNVMIIGCGYWGSKLLGRFIGLLGGEHIVACDPKFIDQTSELEEPHLSFVTDYEAILSTGRIDACVVATPISTHYEITKTCLEAGAHVLVEKPMAKTRTQALELIELASDKKLVLKTDLTFLYDHRLSDSRLEGLEGMTWGGKKSKNSDENILWTWGPHPVSIMLAKLGWPASSAVIRKTQDSVYVVFNYEDRGEDRGTVSMVLDWGEDKRKQRELTGGDRDERFKIDLSTPFGVSVDQEPLTRVCEGFIRDCSVLENDGQRFDDTIGLTTVEVIEWIESNSSL
jgi:hypothetical protein